jgi:hypothetical protein
MIIAILVLMLLFLLVSDPPASDATLYFIRLVVSLLVSLWVAYRAIVINNLIIEGGSLIFIGAAWLISYSLVYTVLTVIFFGAEKTMISRVIDRATDTRFGQKINDVFRPDSDGARGRRALAWRARWERGKEGLRLTPEPRRWWRARANADAHNGDREQR